MKLQLIGRPAEIDAALTGLRAHMHIRDVSNVRPAKGSTEHFVVWVKARPLSAQALIAEPAGEPVELDGETIIALETAGRGTPVQGWTFVARVNAPDLANRHVIIRDQDGRHYAAPERAWVDAAARDRVVFTPVRVTPGSVGTTRYDLVGGER